MPSQGPNGPATGADDAGVGTLAWTNPGNVAADDSNYAVANSPGAATSHYLKATNFAFSIPAGSTIDGIQVEWKRFASSGTITDNRVRIVKGGVIGATEAGSGGTWATSEQYDTFGGSAYLWGDTWTSTDINASNFGCALSANLNTNQGNVNFARITVFYTLAALNPGTDGFPWQATSTPPRLRQTIEAVPY